MSPEIADTVQHAKEMIGFERPVEVFVKPSPVFNASVMRNDSGPVSLILSSRMLEVFTPEELRFVVGHELGHALFDHFGIPMPAVAAMSEMGVPFVPRHVSLQLYAWCRAAELTADRVGLVCAQDPDAAASGFFKLASGMSSARVRPDLATYARQVESLASAPLAREEIRDDDDSLDCFSTHPYSPVRVRAVYAFSRSQAYQKALGRPATGLTDDELEAIVMRDLSLMEPGYLEEKSDHSDLLRKLLYSAGLVVAAANGHVDKVETDALGALLGKEFMNAPFNVENAHKDLDGRMAVVAKEVPLLKRAQLMQHLTVIAASDGSVEDSELAVLRRVCDGLGVDFNVVQQTMDAAASPMD
jgi:uncharacterized tellurite resistance protein B-like protein